MGDNAASLSYIKQKRKFSERVGIAFDLRTFNTTISEAELLGEIERLNRDASVSGFIIQLPLPAHIDRDRVIAAIDPRKDVDGFTPENIGELFLGRDHLASCTPKGIMRLLEVYNIDILGKNVVIIGKSNIVGKPLSLLMMNAGGTVTVCGKETLDVTSFTRQADIVVVAVGVPKLLASDMVRPGTVIVDVGINIVDGKMVGDTDFRALEPLCPITPVPGGVGPMTVAMLMENTYLAATHP